MNMLSTSGFGCRFSVLAVPRQQEMFMMNMQVYDILPHPVASAGGDVLASGNGMHPVSVVWCAVFNVKGMRKAG